MSPPPSSKRTLRGQYYNLVKVYTRRASILFLLLLQNKKPGYEINDLNYHTEKIMKSVLLAAKRADKSNLPNSTIDMIVTETVIQYIDSLP